MVEILSLIKGLNAQGIAGASLAVVLLVLLGWQGCARHDTATERDAYKNLYEQEVVSRANWELNAQSWETAAAECTRGAQDTRRIAREEAEALQLRIRAADNARRATALELAELKRRVEAGELSLQDLLRHVQSL